MSSFRFHDWPWLLAVIPVLVIGYLSWRREQRSAVLYSSVALMRNLPVTLAFRIKRLLPVVRIVGVILIVVALARPQLGLEEFRIHAEGIAIEMCIDRSGSMRALDFPIEGKRVDRLEAVKYVFRRFVDGDDSVGGRSDDLIGLVVFGGFADAKCPPTLDHGALLEVLDTVQIPEPIRDKQGRVINEALLREEQATAIGDAVAVAIDRLKDLESKSRVIVLLSDGENTAGVVSPEDAADAAAAFGIKIYSIGIGSTGMAPYPAADLFGRQVLQARPVRLDEVTLKMLAQKTGGQYFNAKDTNSLASIYEEIDSLEKTETEGRLYTEYREVFQTLMLPGFACIVLELLLSATRFRSQP
jgi:Ca-activated chloride channel homolog